MKNVEKQVVEAYSETNGQMMFKADHWVDPVTARKILAKALAWSGDGYNEFTPDLLDFFPLDSEILIAREYSVCLYVRSNSRLPSASRVKADEVDVQEDGSTRYWWD